MSPTRILLVEDFRPQRHLIALLLNRNPNLVLVSEAEDGVEAVAQAQQLRPDIILMDIALPRLNGLDAARQVRCLVPTAKIVFLTQETDSDVVREAFGMGAWGYVLKQEMGADLPAALDAVIQGKRFVSDGLGDGLSRR
jgi:DNA-binding NarL/FixJ family response regulator